MTDSGARRRVPQADAAGHRRQDVHFGVFGDLGQEAERLFDAVDGDGESPSQAARLHERLVKAGKARFEVLNDFRHRSAVGDDRSLTAGERPHADRDKDDRHRASDPIPASLQQG